MASHTSSIIEIVQVFFKLGCTAFGGPAAHIAMMEDEIVEKRQWMTHQEFIDLISITNLIPGPNSTEMAMHCGYHRRGVLGLIAAGISFIFPAFCLTLGLAWLYIKTGDLPFIAPFLTGIKPAMVVVIAFALTKLSKKAWNTPLKKAMSLLVLVLIFFQISEVLALIIGGLVAAIIAYLPKLKNKLFSFSLPVLFLTCLKIGAVLYGSGYVLIAYLDAEFIEKLSWLTTAQLLDAVAIGQLTPGPVLTTATVIGYFLLGFPGAILATLGIFLPSFFFVWWLNPILARMKKSTFLSGFLEGVNGGSIALLCYVTFLLAQTVINTQASLVITVVSFIILQFKPFGLGTLSLIAISAILGVVLS